MKMLEEIKEEPYLNTTCIDKLQVVGEYPPESGPDITIVKNEIDEVCLDGCPEEVILSKPLDGKDMFCHTCNKQMSYKDISDHTLAKPKIKFSNCDKLLRCLACNYTSYSKYHLERHSCNSHIPAILHRRKTKVFKCDKCTFITTISSRYKRHIIKHSENLYFRSSLKSLLKPFQNNVSTLRKNPSSLSDSVTSSNTNKCIKHNNMPQITQSPLNTPTPSKDEQPNFIVNNITVNNFNAVPATTVLSSPNVGNLQTNPVVNFQTTNVYESNNTNPIILYNGIPLVNNPQVGQSFLPLPNHFLNQNFFVVNAESSSVQPLPKTPQTNLNFQQYPGNYMFLQTPNQVNVQSLPVLQLPNLPNQIKTINNQTQNCDDMSWPVCVENVIPDCVVAETQDTHNLHSNKTACDSIIGQNDKLSTKINNTTLRQILPKPDSIHLFRDP